MEKYLHLGPSNVPQEIAPSWLGLSMDQPVILVTLKADHFLSKLTSCHPLVCFGVNHITGGGGLGDGLLVCPCAFALVSLSWS